MARRHLLGVLVLVLGSLLSVLPARAEPTPWRAAAQTGVLATAAGLTLDSAAAAAPPAYGTYARFGIFDAAPEALPRASRIQVAWSATIPAGAAVRVDVRLFDGARWSDWTLDVPDGGVAAFDRIGALAQARVVLLANGPAPVVEDLRLTSMPLTSADQTVRMQQNPVAPTYHIRATRMGLVGDRTANGHIIQPNDWFVSLPSFRSLSSKGGSEYMARLSYKGRSIVVPVWEVGPWNIRDDYWNVNREKYADLPVGWPQDHAAYFEGYNGGWAEKGRVRFPTAADVGDGAWLALGIPFNDEQEELDITFLWLGSDPGANPAPLEPGQTAGGVRVPAPPAPENIVQVDNADGGFARAGAPWYSFGCGINQQALWTYTTTKAANGTNSATWTAQLSAGTYTVQVFVPYCVNGKRDTTSAVYGISHADGSATVTVNQAANAGSWVTLGTYRFDGPGTIRLTDVGGDSMRAVWFDAARFVRQ